MRRVSSAQPLLIKYWLMVAVSGSSLTRTTLQRLTQQQLAATHVLPNDLRDGDRDMERAKASAAFNQRQHCSGRDRNPSCTALYRPPSAAWARRLGRAQTERRPHPVRPPRSGGRTADFDHSRAPRGRRASKASTGRGSIFRSRNPTARGSNRAAPATLFDRPRGGGQTSDFDQWGPAAARVSQGLH
jgi:hypothetical protein